MRALFDEGPFAACPTPFNLAAYVLEAGQHTPAKDALVIASAYTEEKWSYSDVISAVRGIASGLKSEGLTPGDRVLMRLGNTVDFPLSFLGALTAGLVPVPTSAALTAPETAYVIDVVKPKLILRDPDVACPSPPGAIICESDMLRSWRALPAAPFHMGDPEREGYIIFTSGTTGLPRAVVHAQRAIWARRMMFDGWYGLKATDRMLHAGAFNWTYTLGTGLLDPWTCGATAVVPAPGTPGKALGALLDSANPTIFAAAPGVYRQMLDQRAPQRVASLRHGLSAGEKLPLRTAQRWHAATGTHIYEAFGMSECSTFISQPPGHPIAPDALGRPQKGRRIAVVKDGVPVEIGEDGVIAVHRSDPGLMLGYLNAPEETQQRFMGEWFLTGDHAIMRPDHTLIYRGRADDMMNAGGFRVSPLEIEKVLCAIDGIEAAAVAEVEIKAETRVIAAFYTGPHALDDATLRTYVEKSLARYKHPRAYLHLPQLPVGPNGKIMRRALAPIFKRFHDPDN